MANQIKAWLGELIESGLSDIVSWQSVVKQEPGVPRVVNVGRFEDDGSNYRALVGESILGRKSKVQVLKASNPSVRDPITVSDGETCIKARLSSDAWASYAEALEGEDPLKGDILALRDISIISTPYGPPDDQIQLLVTRLTFEGVNARKSIGQPRPIMLRPSVQDLIAQTDRIRMSQYEHGCSGSADHGVNEIVRAPSPATEERHSTEPALQPLAIPLLEVTLKQGSNPRLNTQLSFAQSSPDRSPVFETQLPVGRMSSPSRSTPRRGRGGHMLIGTHGIEPTHGVNLAQPQAPGLMVKKITKAGATVHQPTGNEALLGLLLNRRTSTVDQVCEDAQVGAVSAEDSRDDVNQHHPIVSQHESQVENLAKSAPQPTAPVSAQAPSAQEVARTATLGSKHCRPLATQYTASTLSKTGSPRAARKAHRIPAAQRRLLNDKSCWVPPLPGQRLPHPNVPVELLEAWNAKAQATTKAPIPTPEVPIADEIGSNPEGSDHAVEPSVAGAVLEDTHSDSDVSQSDEDENAIPGWSQEASQQTALPPDSSAEEKRKELSAQSNTIVGALSHKSSPMPGTKRPMTVSETESATSAKRRVVDSMGRRSVLSTQDPPIRTVLSPESAAVHAQPTGTYPTARASTTQEVFASRPDVSASPRPGAEPRTPSTVVPIRYSSQRVPETNSSLTAVRHIDRPQDRASQRSSVGIVEELPTWNGAKQGLNKTNDPSRTDSDLITTPPGLHGSPGGNVSRTPTGPRIQSVRKPPTGHRNPQSQERAPRGSLDGRVVRSASGQFHSPSHLHYPLPARPTFATREERPITYEKMTHTESRSSQPYNSRNSIDARPATSATLRQSSQSYGPARAHDLAPRSPWIEAPRRGLDSYRPSPAQSSQLRNARDMDGRASHTNPYTSQHHTKLSQPASSSEIQMVPPLPLRGYENDDYHSKRSRYFRGAIRKGWLVNHLTEEAAGSYDLASLLEAYRAATPKDSAPEDEFRQAIQELYPCAVEIRIGAVSGSTDTVAAKENVTSARNIWRECRYGKEIAHAFGPGSTPERARHAYAEREAELDAMAASSPLETNPQTQLASPVNLFEAREPSDQANGQAADMPATGAKQTARQPAKAINGESSRKGKAGPTADSPKSLQTRSPSVGPSIYAEFAQAWKRNSAFVRRDVGGKPYASHRRALDVLGWELG